MCMQSVTDILVCCPPCPSLRYFKKSHEQSHPKSRSGVEESANAAELVPMGESKTKKRRGTYHFYDAELRAKIGCFAAENINEAAVKKYSAELSYAIPESTVHSMKCGMLE